MKKVALCAIAGSFLVLATAADRAFGIRRLLEVLCSSADPVRRCNLQFHGVESPTDRHASQPRLIRGVCRQIGRAARPSLFRRKRRAQGRLSGTTGHGR